MRFNAELNFKNQSIKAFDYSHENFENVRRFFIAHDPPKERLNALPVDQLVSYWQSVNCFHPHQAIGDVSPETYIESLDADVMTEAVQTFSPQFIGHMTSALPYFTRSVTDRLIQWNQNVVKIETSRILTVIERSILETMHSLFYNKSEAYYQRFAQDAHVCLGSFCSGGTLANITALWVARNQWQEKNPQTPIQTAVIYASELAHYSIQKAINLLGLLPEQLVRIPTNKDGAVDVTELNGLIQYHLSQNLSPMALIGVAGATETGSIDPLETFARIAQASELFFHVDAAWGGAFILSQYKILLKGIESADSITVDPHKQLYTPMGLGLILFKNKTSAQVIEHHAKYILRKGSVDLGQYSLEGSRPANALYLHANLSIFGLNGYGALLDRSLWLCQKVAHFIVDSKEFELMNAPQLNILTYRYNPWKLEIPNQAFFEQSQAESVHKALDKITIWLQKHQRSFGQYFVSRTQVKENERFSWVFRVVFANPLTTFNHFEKALKEQLKMLQHEECQKITAEIKAVLK